MVNPRACLWDVRLILGSLVLSVGTERLGQSWLPYACWPVLGPRGDRPEQRRLAASCGRWVASV